MSGFTFVRERGGRRVQVEALPEVPEQEDQLDNSSQLVHGSTAMDEDQSRSPSPVEMEAVEDKKSGDKEVAAGKLVKLRAFNLFAARIRDTIKDENPDASGHEIKRIVGQKWAQLGSVDKQEFIDVAQNENDLIEKLPVDPNAPKRRRRRRTKAEIEMDGMRKRRGRPRKTGDATNGEGSNGLIPEAEGEPKRKRMRQHNESAGKDADPAYIGKYVSGTGDGSVDVGYLVTIREGDTDMVFRGVIFDPYISTSTHNANDAAPGVKLARRNAGVVYPPTGPASTSKQILGPGLTSGTVSLVK